ncbi:putative transcription factor B3-Domain family [Helianthus anomalus]
MFFVSVDILCFKMILCCYCFLFFIFILFVSGFIIVTFIYFELCIIMDVFFFQIQQENRENVFLQMFFISHQGILVIPEIFCKTWLSYVVDNNNVAIRCVNDKTWLVNFAGHNGRFGFMEGWEKVVADLSLSEGTVLVFRKIRPYTFLLTPFMKVAPYQHCQQKFVMFSAISSFVHKKYIESFCHFVNENTVERLLLPTDFVKNTIGVSKLKGLMKQLLFLW